jgi:hypothetical protein
MALENLFAAEPELPNAQKTKLPENTDKWAETLTTQVREQFPDVAKNPINVEFRKRDDQSGSAVGAVHVISLEAQKTVYIPFVIEKSQLHPLDVWMEKGNQKVHPLTKDTFKEQFFTHNFSEGLDQRPADSMGNYFNDPSLWTQTYPPLQGRYSYASAGYGVLDQISDTMSEKDLESFRETLKGNPMLLSKFAKNEHTEVVQKLAAKKSPVNTNDYANSAAKLIPTSIIDVKKEGYNKYSILSMSEGMFDLASSSTHFSNRESCLSYLSKIIGKPEDFLNDVDQNGEKMAILKPAPTKGVWLYDTQEKGAVTADKFTCYWVKNKNGLMIDALVIPKVVNFEGKVIKGKMVLSATHSCFQDNVAGVEYKDSACMEKVLKPKAIRTGQTGVFVYVGENGNAISTLPVTIKSVDNSDKLSVVDINGKSFMVRLGWGKDFRKNDDGMLAGVSNEKTTTSLESLGFAEVKDNYYVIPEKMAWIPMEPMTEVVSTPNEWMEKTAAEKMDMDPVRMRYTGIVYEFSGHGLPKIAASQREAKMLLAQLGTEQEKIASIMKRAERLGKVTLHGAATLKPASDFNQVAVETVAKVASVCEKLKHNLIKEASEVDDKATVDVLLSLNFLNPDNLAKFVSYIPLLEACADKLAELTLASRLGMVQVSGAATASGMSKLIETLEGLKRIEGSMKKPTSKAG